METDAPEHVEVVLAREGGPTVQLRPVAVYTDGDDAAERVESLRDDPGYHDPHSLQTDVNPEG